MSLKHLLEQASKAYYEGKPIMPDYQFDEIAKLYDWKNVGYEGNEDRIKHKYKIYSLQKFFGFLLSYYLCSMDYGLEINDL